MFPKKIANKNENQLFQVERIFVCVYNYEKYWKMMPQSMPPIPEETKMELLTSNRTHETCLHELRFHPMQEDFLQQKAD